MVVRVRESEKEGESTKPKKRRAPTARNVTAAQGRFCLAVSLSMRALSAPDTLPPTLLFVAGQPAANKKTRRQKEKKLRPRWPRVFPPQTFGLFTRRLGELATHTPTHTRAMGSILTQNNHTYAAMAA